MEARTDSEEEYGLELDLGLSIEFKRLEAVNIEIPKDSNEEYLVSFEVRRLSFGN